MPRSAERPLDRWRPWVAPAVALVVVAAGLLTLRLGPYGRDAVADAVGTEAAARSFANTRGGPQCVGWPTALVTSTRTAAVDGTVAIGTDRSHFAATNRTTDPVTLTVTATGGRIDPVTGTDGAPTSSGGVLSATLEPGQRVSFDVACPVTELRFETGTAPIVAADGSRHDSPFVVRTTRRG